jgi:hypothetical protein
MIRARVARPFTVNRELDDAARAMCRRVSTFAAPVVAAGALLQRGELAGQRPREAGLVGDLG